MGGMRHKHQWIQNLPVSQTVPSHPGAQEQVKRLVWCEQVPPFWHGLLEHSLMSESNKALRPEYVGQHFQMHPIERKCCIWIWNVMEATNIQMAFLTHFTQGAFPAGCTRTCVTIDCINTSAVVYTRAALTLVSIWKIGDIGDLRSWAIYPTRA